ncbi:MAG: hypothetical protein SOW31_11345 [Treponema sp.]|nr:hypothetical protein [Treponema sp.]
MKNIFRIFKGNKEIRNQKYYLTNFHGDIIVSNLTKKEADDYIRNYKKEKLYIQEELNFG